MKTLIKSHIHLKIIKYIAIFAIVLYIFVIFLKSIQPPYSLTEKYEFDISPIELYEVNKSFLKNNLHLLDSTLQYKLINDTTVDFEGIVFILKSKKIAFSCLIRGDYVLMDSLKYYKTHFELNLFSKYEMYYYDNWEKINNYYCDMLGMSSNLETKKLFQDSVVNPLRRQLELHKKSNLLK